MDDPTTVLAAALAFRPEGTIRSWRLTFYISQAIEFHPDTATLSPDILVKLKPCSLHIAYLDDQLVQCWIYISNNNPSFYQSNLTLYEKNKVQMGVGLVECMSYAP